MALKATVYKVIMNVADMDRQFYCDHTLTLARHPSENEARLMTRLFAWLWHANEALTFTKGLSVDDEPDIWRKNDSGEIEQWIEVGLPDERRLKKACARARQVILFTYAEKPAQVWWQQNRAALQRFSNLEIGFLNDEIIQQLTGLCERTMRIQATIQDGEAWLSTATHHIAIKPIFWQRHEP